MLQSLTRAEVTKQPAAKQSGMGFGLATLQPKIAPPLAPSKIAAPIQSNNRPFAKQAEPKAEPKQLEGQPGLKTADAKPPSATTANNPTSKPTALGTSPTTPPVKANPDSARGLAAQIASAKAAQKKAKPAGKTAVAKVASGVAGVEAKPMPVEGKAPVPALPDLSKAAPTATSAKALGLPPMITPPNQAARITSNFVQAPLSSKIRQMTGLGTQLSQGEQSDRLVTAQTTPPLSLAINPAPPMLPPLANSTLPKPKPPGPEPKGPLPTGVGDVEGQAVDTGFHYDTETNPAQIDQEQLAQQKVAQTGAGQGQAELAAVPGSELIKPKSLNQSHPIVLAPAQPTGEYQATSDMQAYLDRPLPDPVRSGADQAYHDYLAPQTAGPNDQVSQAFADRDAQVVQAQTQALATSAKLNKQGNDDQESEMNRAKAEIDGHKADALAEGEAKVASFHQDSEQARQEKLGQVKSGVANSEAQSQIELVKARQAALKKQQEAQAQEAEKRAAERRKPWWKRAWDAITSFVTDIWNAFKSAVNGIIDAAKSVISAVMKACSLLVTALIKAYAAYLKVLVGALLVFFPALKAKVMALIDQAVAVLTDVCNKIIDAVASAILAAVDQVQAAVNKAFAVAEALAEGGLAMLTAILTGNWSELLMIAFKTACKVAGVPPEPILMLLKSVKDNFMEVITHPVAFFSNLGRAVKDGFLNFMKNVGQHVLKGLMGWLMGGLAGAGIELPAKWDLPGIFGLLRQVFGFTLAYVEQVARSVLGDQALDIIFKVVDYFKILINEGPMGLWNLVKEKLADLKEKFVGMIIDFVVGQVVQKAITKLITMIIPGGGIVQAVLGIYNMVQLFFQKLNQIITVVAKWLQSMGQIAKGQVTAAANHIEEVMVDSLPLVFGFLASFIGLGDVPSKLGVLIEKLRTPVRLVLTKAIQGTVRVFKKGWAKLKAGATSLKDKAKAKLSGWWNQRRHFKTKKGDAHELDFVGDPPKLKVASDEPLPMRSRVEKWQGWAAKADARAQEKSSDTKSRLARALSLTQKLEAVANKDEETQAKAPAGDAKTPKPAPQPPTPGELNELISLLVTLFGIFGEKEDAEPRSVEEMQKDLADAAKDLKAFIKAGMTLSEFTKNIPNIQKLYKIKSFTIDDPKKGLCLSINPSLYIGLDGLIYEGKAPHITYVRSNSTYIVYGPVKTLKGYNVGATYMTAHPLTREHPQGSAAQSDVQKEVMELIGTSTGRGGYIRGHLLNHDLGGPGNDSRNISPLNGYLNNPVHYNEFEKPLKAALGLSQYWYYQVLVGNQQLNTGNGTPGSGELTSTWELTAYPLDSHNNQASGTQKFNKILYNQKNTQYQYTGPVVDDQSSQYIEIGTGAHDKHLSRRTETDFDKGVRGLLSNNTPTKIDDSI